MILLGHTYSGIRFTIQKNGRLVAPDSLPTGVLRRNNEETDVEVIITPVVTDEFPVGVYDASFTALNTDDGWTITDHVTVDIYALISGALCERRKFDSVGHASDTVDSGVGPYQLLLTFENEDEPVAGIRVAVKLNNITIAYATTNEDGLAELNVAVLGTYRVVAAAIGFYFPGVDLIVNGDEERTYEMNALSSIPVQEDPDLITGWVYCYNNNHQLAAGVNISGKLSDSNQGDGTSWSEKEFIMTSEADPLGLATRGFLRGGVYQFQRSRGGTIEQTVPLLGDSFALKESIGLS